MFGRLHNARATGSERRAQLAARIADRKIPRREGSHGAHGLLQHRHANPRHTLRQHAAIGPATLFGEPLDDVGGDVQLKARLVDGLAFFNSGDARDVLGAFAHQIGGTLQDLAAILRRRVAPHRISLLGSIERAIEIGFRGMGQDADAFSGCRIENRFGIAVAERRPFAGDEQLQVRVTWGGRDRGHFDG